MVNARALGHSPVEVGYSSEQFALCLCTEVRLLEALHDSCNCRSHFCLMVLPLVRTLRFLLKIPQQGVAADQLTLLVDEVLQQTIAVPVGDLLQC